ncbi:hypothetical protein HO861_08350 [Streptococcus suis]|nr:hypothetical protein [Streptococcus suis]NQQ71079.1 hypothetical protein [Streptococcus suis]HEM5582616.1 hypothetical protein [Streptococcus suis]
MNNLTLVIPIIVAGISAVVSITSIFVSNWLGRKTQLKQAKYEHKKEIYLSLYVPLLKWFHASNFMKKSYYWQVALPRYSQGGRDPLSDLLMDNFEKLPVRVAVCYSDYTQNSVTASMMYIGKEYDYEYEHFAQQASDLYEYIIKELLQEGTKLSKELELPDISSATLKKFADDMERYIGPRYLSLETHSKPLKVQIGPLPEEY